MESLGFLIESIAVGVTIAIVMLVHAVHGNGQDPKRRAGAVFLQPGLPAGFSGWNRLRDHRTQRWPDLSLPGHLAAYVWADDDFRMDPSQYYEGCYAALTDQGMR